MQTQFGSVALQPFTASTLPALERSILVTPSLNTLGTGFGTVSVSWMLPGEQPPFPDGPLTAAAIFASQQLGSSRLVGIQRSVHGGGGLLTFTGFLPTDQYVSVIAGGNVGVLNVSPCEIISMTGVQSGFQYRTFDFLAGNLGGQARVSFPFFGAIDKSLQIQINDVLTSDTWLTVIASSVPVPDYFIPTFIANTGAVAVTTNFTFPEPWVYVKILSALVYSGGAGSAPTLLATDAYSGAAINLGDTRTITAAGFANATFEVGGVGGLIVKTPVTLSVNVAVSTIGTIYYQAIG